MNPIARRWRTWWLARHPLSDNWTLTQGNIYIVPTRAGFVYALTLMVMLLASINYQLNLGYVLTFLLAGSGLMSMHLTHRTLRGLTLHLRPPQPVFAGEAAPLEIVVHGAGSMQPGAGPSPAGLRPSRRAGAASGGRVSHHRHGIGLCVQEEGVRYDEVPWVWIDVPAAGQATAHLSFVPPARGLHAVPVLRAETRYPFGLFRAWTLWRPASQVLAYPAPERPATPLPPAHSVGGEALQSRASEGGELEGVRAYQRGDTLRRIVWKKVARAGELVSRDTRIATQQELWLDYQGTQLPDPEARLSRLAAWVLAAERAGIAHGLRLPGVELPPDQGEPHQRAALRALALWAPAR